MKLPPQVAAERYHDISCGHRVHNHESKCAFLHGHNYRIHFSCLAEQLDSVGRVIDFSIMKSTLCMWLENNWDHRFIAWTEDPIMKGLVATIEEQVRFNELGTTPNDIAQREVNSTLAKSIVWVPFNPTAENLGLHLLNVVGPQLLEGTGVKLIQVKVEETRKCSAVVWAHAQ